MSPITTHVLDVSRGMPAAGVAVTLECHRDGDWQMLGQRRTDDDGRVKDLLADGTQLSPGTYRLTFDTASYFHKSSVEAFYATISIAFVIKDGAQHYHVPLLLSPFGYSTYRGS
jgi:5-hydroxyisourate hydrolase